MTHSARLSSSVKLALWLCLALAPACSVDRGETFAPTDAVLKVTSSAPLIAINTPTTVTVSLTKLDGSAVPDGTVVSIAASSGELDQAKLRIERGTATVSYRSAGQPGSAQITASSGSLSAQLTLTVISAPLGGLTVATSPTILPAGGGEVEVVARASASDGAPVAGAPVTFRTSNGTVNPTSGTTGSDGTARTKLTTTVNAVVVARIGTLDSEPITVRVGPTLRLTLSTTPAQPFAGDPVTVNVRASASDGSVPRGRLKIALGTGQVADLGVVVESGTVTFTYPAAGGYNITAEFTDDFGTLLRETIRITVQAKPVVPPPDPSPSPNPGGPSAGTDEIDPRLITWLHRDVSNWSITSQITDIRITDSQVCIDHTKAGQFPQSPFFDIVVEGNVWIVAQFNGRWYAGTYDWLRPGQICKGVTAPEFGVDQIRIPPMDASWPGPRSGETVGFLVSSRARDNVQAGEERTNIKLVRWP